MVGANRQVTTCIRRRSDSISIRVYLALCVYTNTTNDWRIDGRPLGRLADSQTHRTQSVPCVRQGKTKRSSARRLSTRHLQSHVAPALRKGEKDIALLRQEWRGFSVDFRSIETNLREYWYNSYVIIITEKYFAPLFSTVVLDYEPSLFLNLEILNFCFEFKALLIESVKDVQDIVLLILIVVRLWSILN